MNRHPSSRTVLAGLSALILAATLASTADAQRAADGPISDFELNSDFVLLVDGSEIKKAEIYRSGRAAAFLILTTAFDSPVMVEARTRSIKSLNVMKVSKGDSGMVSLLPQAAVKTLGVFEVDGEELTFTVGGKKAVMRPKPPLLGTHPASGLVDYSASYKTKADNYEPDAGAISALRNSSKGDVKVKVFFGSWCAFCQRYLPNILKVEQELAETGIEFEYIGLPRGFGNHPEAKKEKVTGVPTGIIYVGGKEVGRINNNSWYRPEVTLKNSLQ